MKIITVCAVLVLGLGTLSSSPLAQAAPEVPNAVPTVPDSYMYIPPNTDAWLEETWDSSDKPYAKIRREVDAEVRAKQITVQELERLHKQFSSHPQDPQIMFRWAYASYAGYWSLSVVPEAILPDQSDFLRLKALPHSYNFDRIRLLWRVEGAATLAYSKIAERLLKRDPQDSDVLLATSRIFSSNGDFIHKAIALEYAHQLLRLEPKKPRSYAALGAVYFYAWLENSYDENDAHQALLAYQKYMRLATATDPSYNRVLKIVKWLTSQPPA